MLRRVLAIAEANLGRQDAELGNTVDRQMRKRLRQRELLPKAEKCLKECLAVGEANQDCSRVDMDNARQELGGFLVEAVKLI